MFNVQCFFYAYFKITIGRINHFETITRVVVFTGCAWWQMFFDRRRWSGMFPYPCGQMSDSFANIGRICITQTCKLIYDIGHQGIRGIKEHLSSCTTCKDNYSCNSFKVIDSTNSDFEVSIKEALHIKHKNLNLNIQLSTQGMSFMLKIFT